MKAAHVINQPAYVLHRRPYRETSIILDVFTLYHGRLALMARGAQTSKTIAVANLQVFQPLMLSWTGGYGLRTLTAAEAPSSALRLQSSAMYCAYYVNELVLKLTPEQDATPGLFAAYVDTLQALSEVDQPEPVLRRFELALLQDIGLTPDFEIDLASHPVQPNDWYRYRAPGFERVNDDSHTTDLVQGRHLQKLAQGWADEELETGVVNAEAAKQAKRILRQLINNALNGRQLNSRKMFQQFSKGEKP